jgi:tetratricopeptide (TPR) repeat protein
MRYATVCLILCACCLASAAPAPDADDLIRRGNAAFDRGDYAAAARYYLKAEEHTTDPGLVAFNKAAALYGEGKYEEAENHYWLCLGDTGPRLAAFLKRSPDRDLPAKLRAAGARLPRVLYNLGNCVLQRSQGTNPDLLEKAVTLYDHCLRLVKNETKFKADARHNLELAKEFLRRHPRRPPPRDQSDDDSNNNNQTPKPRNNPGGEQSEPGSEQEPRRDPDSAATGDEANAQEKAAATDQTLPGRGNLRTLPDEDNLIRLSPEEAEAHLRQALQRILGKRREYRQQATKNPPRSVMDW